MKAPSKISRFTSVSFFKTISIRVPMDSISGAHKLTFAGFTGVDGHGGIFHPRTMRALGGADLDGDKAFAFFGMKPEWKEMYHSNKMEFAKKVPGTNDFTIRDNKTAGVPKIGLDILKDIDEYYEKGLKSLQEIT